MAVIKVAFILLFTLASLHGINCQLAGIAISLPQVISLMDNLTDISPYMPQLAALLKDQKAEQLITNHILQNNTSLLPGIISLMQGHHSEILNSLQSLLQNQQETRNETTGTLIQMATTQNQIASSQVEMTNSLSEISNIQSQMATTQSQMATTQSQMATTQSQMATTQSQMATTQSQIASSQEEMTDSLSEISSTQSQMALAMNQMVSLLQKHEQQLENITAAMTSQNQILSTVASLLQKQNERLIAQDCTDVIDQGYNNNYGTYTIKPPDNQVSFQVSCDLQTEGGGWTVFQRRFNGSVDFYRGWEDYKNGFGDLDGEHWLGLDKIHRLTSSNEVWQMRIELEDFYGNTSYAQYDNFVIGDETTYYRLGLGAYSGTAGDSLVDYSANQAFSTYDQDHDANSGHNCAQRFLGAWWYGSCGNSNLNGPYVGSPEINHQGMWWYSWKSSIEVLKKAEMKMRRM